MNGHYYHPWTRNYQLRLLYKMVDYSKKDYQTTSFKYFTTTITELVGGILHLELLI